MENKTFTELWKGMDSIERDRVAIALSADCNTAISTVASWGYGYRTPKVRSQNIITQYLREKEGLNVSKETLFPS